MACLLQCNQTKVMMRMIEQLASNHDPRNNFDALKAYYHAELSRERTIHRLESALAQLAA